MYLIQTSDYYFVLFFAFVIVFNISTNFLWSWSQWLSSILFFCNVIFFIVKKLWMLRIYICFGRNFRSIHNYFWLFCRINTYFIFHIMIFLRELFSSSSEFYIWAIRISTWLRSLQKIKLKWQRTMKENWFWREMLLKCLAFQSRLVNVAIAATARPAPSR